MKYGVANKKGKLRQEEGVEVIEAAWDSGIRYFDTAQAYGESEDVLGKGFEILSSKGIPIKQEVRIVTKLSAGLNLGDIDEVRRHIDNSLRRLNVGGLWGIMLHKESLLEEAGRFIDNIMQELLGEERMCRFGISVYSPERALEALNMDGIDIVQVPFNVFDQRALKCDLFDIAYSRGKVVFVRSIYLQGLLLLEPSCLPKGMEFSRTALVRYRDFAKQYGISPKLLAMAFVVQKAPKAFIVIGAETPEQVRENVELFERAGDLCLPEISLLSENDEKLINPSLWAV